MEEELVEGLCRNKYDLIDAFMILFLNQRKVYDILLQNKANCGVICGMLLEFRSLNPHLYFADYLLAFCEQHKIKVDDNIIRMIPDIMPRSEMAKHGCVASVERKDSMLHRATEYIATYERAHRLNDICYSLNYEKSIFCWRDKSGNILFSHTLVT